MMADLLQLFLQYQLRPTMRKQQEPQQLQQGQFPSQSEHESQQSSQYLKPTKSGRKHLCDTCVKSLAKYTCPGCHLKSCTLACINRHKQTHNCDGKADNTAYVEKGRIDGDTVRRDYQFVKAMMEETDKVKKTLTGVTAHVQEPKRFYFLRKQARLEHNIKVHQAPAMIERHRENISFYYMKTKTIYWVIEILYYKGNKKYQRTLLEPQPDTKTIAEVLPTNFLSQELLLKEINTQKTEQFDIFIQNRQRNVQQGQPEQKQILQLQPTSKIVDSLKNMNVYEFPTFILVHKSLRKMFTKWKKFV